MGRLLLNLGFTESKEDFNLCFKVERPMMLLLYVDDLFLIEKRNSLNLQEEDLLSSSDKGLVDDALHSRHGGVDKGSMQ